MVVTIDSTALLQKVLRVLSSAVLSDGYDARIVQCIALINRLAPVLDEAILSLPAVHWQKTDIKPLLSLGQAISSIAAIKNAGMRHANTGTTSKAK